MKAVQIQQVTHDASCNRWLTRWTDESGKTHKRKFSTREAAEKRREELLAGLEERSREKIAVELAAVDAGETAVARASGHLVRLLDVLAAATEARDLTLVELASKAGTAMASMTRALRDLTDLRKLERQAEKAEKALAEITRVGRIGSRIDTH